MSGSVEKFPLGPIIEPSPGPTFEIEVAAPEIEVIKSSPVNDNNAAITKKIKNMIKKSLGLVDLNFFYQFLMKKNIL